VVGSSRARRAATGPVARDVDGSLDARELPAWAGPPVAVAMADRLSALLAEKVAREARRAGLPSALMNVPYSDLRTRIYGDTWYGEGVRRVPSGVGDRAFARSFPTSLPASALPERHVRSVDGCCKRTGLTEVASSRAWSRRCRPHAGSLTGRRARDPLRIAMLAPPWISVPAPGYGRPAHSASPRASAPV
jgi:hypothetical protein